MSKAQQNIALALTAALLVFSLATLVINGVAGWGAALAFMGLAFTVVVFLALLVGFVLFIRWIWFLGRDKD